MFFVVASVEPVRSYEYLALRAHVEVDPQEVRRQGILTIF